MSHRQNQWRINSVVNENTSLFNVSSADAKAEKPLTVRAYIQDVLLAQNGACYQEMEKYLISPGVSGSVSFDQCAAVMVLLDHDSDQGSAIAKLMDLQPALNYRVLWALLQAILRQVGFNIRYGRITGLNDHKKRGKAEY